MFELIALFATLITFLGTGLGYPYIKQHK